MAWARHDQGLLTRDHGDLRSAAELLRASLRDFREPDYPWAVAWSAWGLGTTLSAQGRLEEAAPLLAEALRIYTEVNDPRGVAQCLEALAHVASERAHYESAARLIGAAAALREQVAARQPDTEQARTSSVERVLARALGPQDADTLMHARRTMPAHQAADLAIAVASGAAPADPTLSIRCRSPRGSGKSPRWRPRPDQPADRQGLGISEKTAEVHLHHVMSKLDARSGRKWPPGPSRSSVRSSVISCPVVAQPSSGPEDRATWIPNGSPDGRSLQPGYQERKVRVNRAAWWRSVRWAAFPDDPLVLALLARGPLEVQLMRARLPDESGYVVNSGVRIHYEVHGTGQPTILLLPTWAIVDPGTGRCRCRSWPGTTK